MKDIFGNEIQKDDYVCWPRECFDSFAYGLVIESLETHIVIARYIGNFKSHIVSSKDVVVRKIYSVDKFFILDKTKIPSSVIFAMDLYKSNENKK